MHFDYVFDRALKRWMDEFESPHRWLPAVYEMSRVYHDRVLESGGASSDVEYEIFSIISFYS